MPDPSDYMLFMFSEHAAGPILFDRACRKAIGELRSRLNWLAVTRWPRLVGKPNCVIGDHITRWLVHECGLTQREADWMPVAEVIERLEAEPGGGSDRGASMRAGKLTNSDDRGDEVPTLKPSRAKAKALYEWALENIEGAESMTYAQLFDVLQNDPRCGGEGLPGNAAAFARYCRDAGIYRNTPRRAKGPTRSVRRASDL